MRLFKFACKEGEGQVYFDHVLDVVGRGYHLVVDFAHAHALLVLRWTLVHEQNWPLNGNHIQLPPARDQNIPGSPPNLPYMQTEIISQGREPGYEATLM